MEMTSFTTTLNSVANTAVKRDAKPLASRALYGAFNNTEHKIIPISEVIEQAKCNYTVEKQPLIRVTPEMLNAIRMGLPIEGLTERDIIETHCATRREDTNQTLGIVGADYGVVQNAKAFEFIDHIQKHFGQDSIIETAGALGIGERMYVTCKLGADFYLDEHKKDAVNNYIIITTTHNGSGAIKILSSPVRVICQNTLNMALMKKTDSISYKHTKNVQERLDYDKIVAKFIENSELYKKDFITKMTSLRETKVSTEGVQDFAARIYLSNENFDRYIKANRKIDFVEEISTRAKNQIEKLQNSIDFGVGQEMYRGSKLWLLNGLTTMLHNDIEYKSAEDEFISLTEGDGLKKLEKAYSALELIA